MPVHPQAADYGPVRVVMPAPSDPRYAHLGWPKMVLARDGSVYLAYLTASGHTWGGCPAVGRSSDGGRSFSTPVVLADYYPGETYVHSGNLAIGEAEDGSIVILAMAMTEGSRRSDIFGWRQVGAGSGWDPVDTRSLTGSVYGNLVHLPGHGLAVTGHCREGAALGRSGLWLALSRDCGRSWSEPWLITGEPLVEPAFCLAQGRIIGLAKGRTVNGYRQFVSDDAGVTWQAGDSGIGARVNMTSPSVFTDPGHPSRLFAFETQRQQLLQPDSELPGYIALWTAEATALHWNRVGTVATFHTGESPPDGAERPDYGYPWMVQTAVDTWFCVFYCGRNTGSNPLWGLELHL